MTVNLLTIDDTGQEQISQLFADPEDREQLNWVMELELAAPGCIIFIHRLSPAGHYLCTVPAPHERLVSPEHPSRYCGCYKCIAERKFLIKYTGRQIIYDMEEMFPESFVREHYAKESGEYQEPLSGEYVAKIFIRDMYSLIPPRLVGEIMERSGERFR